MLAPFAYAMAMTRDICLRDGMAMTRTTVDMHKSYITIFHTSFLYIDFQQQKQKKAAKIFLAGIKIVTLGDSNWLL